MAAWGLIQGVGWGGGVALVEGDLSIELGGR